MPSRRTGKLFSFLFVVVFAGLLIVPTSVMLLLPRFPMRFSSEEPLPGRPTARAVASEEIETMNYISSIAGTRNYAVVTSDSWLVEIAQSLLTFRSFGWNNNIFVDPMIITDIVNNDVSSTVNAAGMTNSSMVFLVFNDWYLRVRGISKTQVYDSESYFELLGGHFKTFGEQYHVYLMWIDPSHEDLITREISDFSMEHNDGFLSGSALIAPGIKGHAVLLFGRDASVEVNNSESFNLQRFTVESWVKLNTNSTYVNPVVSRWYSGGNPSKDQFILAMYPTRNEVYFYLSDGVKISYVSTSICPTYQWLHIATTYDGQYMRIYFNGSLTTEKECTGSVADINSTLFVGSKSPEVEPQSFYGLIDEVRIYNRALNSTEIAYSYQNLTPLSPDGLVLWFSFD